MSAIDRDLGSNGDLEYSLYNGQGAEASEYFNINRNTGAITLKESLEEKGNFIYGNICGKLMKIVQIWSTSK